MTIEAQRPSDRSRGAHQRDRARRLRRLGHQLPAARNATPSRCCARRAPSTSTRSPWPANPSSAQPAWRASCRAARKRPSPASATGRHGPPCTPSCSGSRSTETSRARCCGTRRCSSAHDRSRDLAAVLASRLEANATRDSGPLPWLPARAAPARRGRLLAPLLRPARRTHPAPRRRRPRGRQHAGPNRAAPAWAVPTLNDPDLTRDLAIWRAAHEVPDTDLRPTGPPAIGRQNGYQQHRLDRRVSDAGGDARRGRRPDRPNSRETLHPGITADPHWPTLAQQLYSPTAAGIDARRAATHRHRPSRCRSNNPPPAFAYRLVDAIGERPAPAQPPPKPAPVRPYEPGPLPAAPPDHVRTAG